ncbi:Protein sine1 [Trifolium repens]|nr:Protein sine1 [Trifolium repens]
MSMNLSPVLRKQLENLDKDADSRKSAMIALKSYVKDMDFKSIPIFLAQVSQTKEIDKWLGILSSSRTSSLTEKIFGKSPYTKGGERVF